MGQNIKEKNEEFVKIEQLICDFFCLDYSDVYSKNTRRDITLARHLTIFVLHKHYKVSWSELSNRYNHSVRHIGRICADIKSLIEYNKKYKHYYYCLIRYINKGE